MADAVWVQTDPTLNRDDVNQWFHSTATGIRVFGRTSGTMSDHIHLHYPDTGIDSGLNMDATSGEVSKDGNVLADALAVFAITVEAAVGGVVGAGSAAVNASKTFFTPSGQEVSLDGLIFPPLPKQP